MSTFDDLFKKSGLREVQPEDLSTFSLLLFGLAGTGKSSLAATASKCEDLSPVLYIDFENGTMPLGQWGDLDKTTIVHCDSWNDCVKLFENVIKPSIDKGEFPFKTVVIDTLDQLQELVVNHFQTINPKDTFAAWAAAYEAPRSIIKALSDAKGVSLIAITHAERETNEVTGATLVSPSFEGKKSIRKLPSLFDFVGYMSWVDTQDEKGNDVLVPALFTQEKSTLTKQRITGFPEAIGNPTMSKFYGFIKQALNKTN